MRNRTFLKYIFLGALVFSMLFQLNPNTMVTAESKELDTVTAGFIYVGPIGDYGWTNAHDSARVIVDDKYDWLDTVYVESIGEDPASVVAAVDAMLAATDAPDIIFTTSFGFMDGTVQAAEKYPDTMFFHASGYKRAANMGTYMADFYQIYYLNGLMAGALTESDKLGYVGAFPIPEVIRHINAFAIGAKEANPDATVDVRWINSWYDPTAAKNAANALIADGVDMLAFTEDSPAVVEVADETDGVYAFSHYSPMQSYGPESTISGQLVHWEVIYDEVLTKVKDGTYTSTNLVNEDYLYFIHENGVELGGEFGVPINPLFEDDLKGVNIGDDTAYDLIFDRIDQMNDSWADVDFDPFMGPIKAQNGTVMIADGERASIPDLFSDMMWFVDNVKGSTTGEDPDETESAPPDFVAITFGFAAIAVVQYRRRRKD